MEKKMSLLKSLQEEEGMTKLGKIKKLQAEINKLMEEEDLKWKQLAKEHWLKN